MNSGMQFLDMVKAFGQDPGAAYAKGYAMMQSDKSKPNPFAGTEKPEATGTEHLEGMLGGLYNRWKMGRQSQAVQSYMPAQPVQARTPVF